jgi:Lrp/AsnC family leucine-responsive transcriptional regulator
MTIDDKDRKILNLLQQNARMPNVDIARALKMAPSVVFERLKKLERNGVIQSYEVRLNPTMLEKGMLAFISVRTDEHVGGMETAKRLAKIPEVQEVHHISGEDCYLVKVRVADTQDLSRVMREHFGKIKSIRSTRTTIVFETVKETIALALREEKAGKKNSNTGFSFQKKT